MYDYRTWTPEQKAAIVVQRQKDSLPWHGPPHFEAPGEYRIVTGACYEHRQILKGPDRLAWFAGELLSCLAETGCRCDAWVVLPNHYHVLLQVFDMRAFSRQIGQLHGRTSFVMNKEDGIRGRQVWYRCQDRCMRSEAHYYATLNYIHNNPVKHGHAKLWTDWPYSSIHAYLDAKGRDWLVNVWRSYPLYNYGDRWDP
jgi:putative transposase